MNLSLRHALAPAMFGMVPGAPHPMLGYCKDFWSFSYRGRYVVLQLSTIEVSYPSRNRKTKEPDDKEEERRNQCRFSQNGLCRFPIENGQTMSDEAANQMHFSLSIVYSTWSLARASASASTGVVSSQSLGSSSFGVLNSQSSGFSLCGVLT